MWIPVWCAAITVCGGACSATAGANSDGHAGASAPAGSGAGVSHDIESDPPLVEGSPEPPVLAGIGTAFCDGSSDIRLGMWTGAGSLGGFMRPFGFEFAFVDGSCAYVASSDADHGIATGVLDSARVEELARDVGYAKIAELSAHTDELCFEAEPSVISDGSASFGCGCECDEGTPPELVAAEAASHRWIKRLVADASDSAVAVRAAALIDDNGPYADSPAWPLARPITDFVESRDTIGWIDAGILIDDPDDAAALRALRAVAAMRGSGIYVIEGTQQYSVQVRDELPATTDAAVRAFRNAPTR